MPTMLAAPFGGVTVANTKSVTATDSCLRSIRIRNKLVEPETIRVYPSRRYNRHKLIARSGCCNDRDDNKIPDREHKKCRLDPSKFVRVMWTSFGYLRKLSVTLCDLSFEIVDGNFGGHWGMKKVAYTAGANPPSAVYLYTPFQICICRIA
jgi:hypothetical protein